MEILSGISKGDGGWHDGPQEVDRTRGIARRRPADLEEMKRMYSSPATLTLSRVSITLASSGA
jgi:hypothetical protein